jgi:chemotaxis signal transduction protein
MSATAYVKCDVGPVAVALPLARVVGVERADRVRTGGGPPRVVTRGTDWPVLSLAERLGVAHANAGRLGQVVLVEAAGRKIGLLVDRVSPAGRAQETAAAPAAVAAGPYAGVLLNGSSPLPVLDADKLFETTIAPTRSAAPRHANTPKSTRTLIVGTLDVSGRTLGFALPARGVLEIIDAEHAAAVPGAGPHVVATAVWRNNPVPVFDVARWVGLDANTDRSRVVIVAGRGNKPVGLAAGGAVRVLESTASMPTRRKLSLNDDRVLAVHDLTHLTLIMPDWTQLL